MDYIAELLNSFYRRASYFLMGYRRAPFTIVRLKNKRRFWPLRANTRFGSMKRGVFSRKHTASQDAHRIDENCHLWPDGMRWHFLVFAVLITIPIAVVGFYQYAFLSFFFILFGIPLTVYGFFRLPVLDFIKESMPKLIYDRVDRFPLRSRFAFILCLLICLISFLLIYPTDFSSLIKYSRFENLNFLPVTDLYLQPTFKEITQELLNNQITIIENLPYFGVLALILIVLVIVFLIVLALPLVDVLKFVCRMTIKLSIAIFTDFYHFFIPPVRTHGDTVFFSPKGSIKESLIRLALCEFYEREQKDKNHNYIWTSRSFVRYLFYWCSPVWGSYFTLLLLLLPYMLFLEQYELPGYKTALYFSGLVWMLYSAIFLWVQSQSYNHWIMIEKEDLKMLPPILVSEIKGRPVSAEVIIKDKAKLVIQIITGLALTLYWTLLRYAIT